MALAEIISYSSLVRLPCQDTALAVLLYKKGKRYTIMYFGFGDSFDKYSGAFEEVVKSLRIL